MRTFRIRCECCATLQEFDNSDVCLRPWPHVTCLECGAFIPVF